MGAKNIVNKGFTYTTAKTNHAMMTPAATERIVVMRCKVIAAGSNADDVSYKIGFADTTLPADSEAGEDGVFATHGGLMKGAGELEAMGGEAIAIGAMGQPLRITSSLPTSGSLKVVIGHQIWTNQDQT